MPLRRNKQKSTPQGSTAKGLILLPLLAYTLTTQNVFAMETRPSAEKLIQTSYTLRAHGRLIDCEPVAQQEQDKETMICGKAFIVQSTTNAESKKREYALFERPQKQLTLTKQESFSLANTRKSFRIETLIFSYAHQTPKDGEEFSFTVVNQYSSTDPATLEH